ncbi:MAG: hypothetical protein K0Q99_546 [Clostridia bacterium]|jgi:hypothetical protein|nr:hypothetical protein [Clostridia bacterium]
MQKRRSQITALMTFVLSMLALYAALTGVLDKSLYEEIVAVGTISRALQVGSIAQDIVSIPLAITLALLSLKFLKKPGYKSFITILGLAWYFFYAYGLYVMQGQYTSIYILYLSIFSLSIYSMIWGIISFNLDEMVHYHLPKVVRISIGIFLCMIVFILGPAWIARMSIDVIGRIPGETYAVFILDLGIVFPALGLIAMMLFKKNPFGYVLAGIALLKSFTLCLSWAFAQWYSPIYGTIPFDIAMTALSTILTFISLILFIPYMMQLKRLNKEGQQ